MSKYWKKILAGLVVVLALAVFGLLFFGDKPFNAETEAPQVEQEIQACAKLHENILILRNKIIEDESRRMDSMADEIFLEEFDDILLDRSPNDSPKPGARAESRNKVYRSIALGAFRKNRYNDWVDRYNRMMQHIQWYYSKGGKPPKQGIQLPGQLGKLSN